MWGFDIAFIGCFCTIGMVYRSGVVWVCVGLGAGVGMLVGVVVPVVVEIGRVIPPSSSV